MSDKESPGRIHGAASGAHGAASGAAGAAARTASPPLWRRGFDLVEGGIRPRLEDLVGAEQFAVAVGLVARAQHAAQRSSERATRRLLHSFNLPAGSDVNRILAELGRLERQVSSLRRQLDTARGGPGDGDQPGPQRSARPPSARR